MYRKLAVTKLALGKLGTVLANNILCKTQTLIFSKSDLFRQGTDGSYARYFIVRQQRAKRTGNSTVSESERLYL